MNEPAPPKKRWGCLIWTVVIITTLLLAFYLIPRLGYYPAQAYQVKNMKNARVITTLLHAFAAEHRGYYPDHGNDLTSLTSNEVFREIIRQKPSINESIFGGYGSRFMPDKNIGIGPDYKEALTAGENNWAMTAGLSQTASLASFPLVFENPVDTAWPPRWLVGADGKPVPARTSSGGQVIIGFNDGSVEVTQLREMEGFMQLPAFRLDFYQKLAPSGLRVLNVRLPGTNSDTDPGSLKLPPKGPAPAQPSLPVLPAQLDPQKSTDPQ